MKFKQIAAGLVSAMLVAGLVPGLQASSVTEAAASRLVVYDDALSNEFTNYSWAANQLAQTEVVHSGTRAVQMTPNNDDALYFYKDRIAAVAEYPVLEMWVHGGTTGGQKLQLGLHLGGQRSAAVALDDYLPDGALTAGKWQQVQIDLEKLQLPGQIFDGIMLQGTTSGSQGAVYIDDVALVQEKRLSRIALTPEAVTLSAGEERTVEAEAVYSDGTRTNITSAAQWVSEQEHIVSAAAGRLTALAAGAAKVQVSYEGKSASVQVTVADAVPTPEPTGSPQPTPQPQPTQDGPGLVIYDDALHEPFQDYSWAQHDLNQQQTVHAGTRAISMDPSNAAGLYLYKGNGPVLTKEYETLEFWVHGGEAGGQQIELKLNAGGATAAQVSVGSLLETGAIPAGGWAKGSLYLPDLQLPGGLFDGILLQGAEGVSQAAVYFDDIRLLPKYVAPPEVTEVILSQYQMVLTPGDTAVLDLTANYNDGTSSSAAAAAVWTSSDPAVLTVQEGALTAHSNGIAKVTAALGDKSASAYVQVTGLTPISVYAEGLEPGYSDWSWGTRDVNSTAQAHSGTQSFSFAARGYEGIWIHKNEQPFDTSRIYGLRFHVYGSGGQKLKALLMDGRNYSGEIELDQLLPEGGLPAGQWTEVTVKLADLGITSPSFDGILVQAWGEQDQGTVYFDDIQMLENSEIVTLPEPELPKVTVAIDSAANRRTLSPDIFGVNFEDSPSANASQMKFPFKRWGGNQMTRYNWELDTTNRGGDWYFLNVPYETGNPGKTLSDQFIEQSMSDQTKVLLQVPTIGWTPKSKDISWSFSIDKYGPQAGNECDYHEPWCRADAGNGQLPNGAGHVTGNDPTDTSKQVGPEFISRWIDHLKEKYGNFVRNYALDNEPALWGHAHWDVHPEMTTYDEIWDYTVDYAGTIKQKDPAANVFGPVSWGWCEYFYSGKDGCYPGEDMETHGDKPFLEWYLSKVREYEQQHGTRLVDVLDIHYYPAEADVPFSNDESPAMTKRRFNSLKSLYDPNFRDDSSWIQEPVYLIPRMRDIIARNAPGTKLAITEYNFGDGSGIGSGLAQAEALAIFAREGVDAATRWGALTENTPLEDAFKLYLNYDGQGSRIEGDVVQTTTSNRDAVGAYTVISQQGQKFMLLFNKDTAPRTAEVSADMSLEGTASLYRFDAKQRLQAAGSVQAANGALSVKLPARSATLVVLP